MICACKSKNWILMLEYYKFIRPSIKNNPNKKKKLTS
ncbi:hypothetical protein Zm00014a_020322 [Zea mays]|uniref:Uncharacterized protein n=1 Tax=Zea mays TaxID=4577 RepID=A0A3L6F3L8_MAIZE|nr:hypothetical protein Zm00014a_020322 [Zea mays]